MYLSNRLKVISGYMKKAIFVIFLSFLFVLSYAQQTEIANSNESQSSLIPDSSLKLMEDVYDFGKIPQGKPVHHNFEFKNIGDSTLNLINVQASCGCTTPEWEKDKPIRPGGSSSIRVGYNAAAEGIFNKTITITYNNNQIKQMTIKGEVWKTPSASAPANTAISDLKD